MNKKKSKEKWSLYWSPIYSLNRFRARLNDTVILNPLKAMLDDLMNLESDYYSEVHIK